MLNISEYLNKLIEGNALPVLKSMPDKCADSIITSPPYYQLRKYEGIPDYIWDGNDECPHNFTAIETKLGNGSGGQASRKQNSNTGSHFVDYSNRVIESSICSHCGAWKGQLGLEPSYQLYLSHLLQIISECKRVLKDEGTMWINLGDSYFGSGHGKWSKYDDGLISHKDKYYGNGRNESPNTDWDYSQYPNKSLILIPYRFAISCIDDLGLILRNDLVWAKCLSGGTKLYAKTSKGIFPQTIHDLVRLKDVELWTGKNWSKVKGFYENKNVSNPLEITLRSGEKIACTKEHKFPTKHGLKRADELTVGDFLLETKFPDNKTKNDRLNSDIIPWFIGLYLAEGSRSQTIIQISSHKKENIRFEKCQQLAEAFDGTCNKYLTSENGMTITISGILINAIIDKFIAGKTAKDKHMTTDFWQRNNNFLDIMLKSYLEADAHYEKNVNRFRLGFTNNKQLVDDLRTIAARLGYSLKIKRHIHKIKNTEYKGYRGELRFNKSNHYNNKKNTEILKISKSNGRKFWDVEIEDDAHLFALGSGILTHNSNGMPESVLDRFSKKHEFIFFFVKHQKYYFDLDAIRDIPKTKNTLRNKGIEKYGEHIGLSSGFRSINNKEGKNPGDVLEFWDEYTKMSLDEYLELCTEYYFDDENSSILNIITSGKKHEHYATYSENLIKKLILSGTPKDGIILDPFAGTGTTIKSAIKFGRNGIGIEGSSKYVELANIELPMLRTMKENINKFI